ncbi:helix-turn-helix transcriptional regulator [Streptomyces sp. XD-27]|uniref:helix-turn-helix domain-containing protein n=1 Tax=Streptomyces sp. XD-27 TaxID=3062779 RepID=UPI0026F40F0E|nr:helix-turn-helix transcriptional regulator [Streptomyces sp. XD-27]WKX72690.1 helix-turn-helix transcriptional regulator [Streptomyces sp. XD-27]
MAPRARPTARRIALGQELRQLRKQAGLTLEQAVRGLPFSETKLQRAETGLQDLRTSGVLRKLLVRYGVTDEDKVEKLLALQREASSQEWWTRPANLLSSGLARRIATESVAQEIHAFHPLLVLGLLQTEAYAQALFDLYKPIEEHTTEFVQENVAARMKRQEPLTRDDEPLKFWAVLYEPALRYTIGGVDVMREQYDAIAKLVARDNVRVQVLPQTHRGYLPPHDFSIMHLGEALPSTIQVDTAWGSSAYADKPREVGRFTRMFNALVASALPPEDTPKFLQRLARETTE